MQEHEPASFTHL